MNKEKIKDGIANTFILIITIIVGFIGSLIGCSKVTDQSNGNNFIVTKKDCYNQECFYHITNNNTDIVIKSDRTEFLEGDSVRIKRK